MERIGPTHIEGGRAEWLQHPDVVEAFCLQEKHTRTINRQSPKNLHVPMAKASHPLPCPLLYPG